MLRIGRRIGLGTCNSALGFWALALAIWLGGNMATNGFEIPSQSAASGLLSGLQSGLQLGQMKRQNRIQDEQLAMQKNQQAEAERQAKWEKGYKTASLAIQTAGIQGLPDEMKARILNNGFLPLWNDPDFDVAGNNAAQFQPFTVDDMQDKDLQNV